MRFIFAVEEELTADALTGVRLGKRLEGVTPVEGSYIVGEDIAE